MVWIASLLGSTLQSPGQAGPAPGQGPRGMAATQQLQTQPQVQLQPGGLGSAGPRALGGPIPGDVQILPPTGRDGLQQDILAQQNMARQQQTDPGSIASLLGNLAMSTMQRPGQVGTSGQGPSGALGPRQQLQVDPATGQLRWVTQ